MARDERVMWLGEMDTEMPGLGSEEEGGEEEYWMKWMREVEETGSEQDTHRGEQRNVKSNTSLSR
jgi:hypothetical protein